MIVPPEAIDHAKRDYPRESCGVIVAGKYFPCRNDALYPGEQFITNRRDLADAMEFGEIEAIVHSHPDASPEPSDADKASCEKTDVPWLIIGIKKTNDGFDINPKWFSPSGCEVSLIGRQYVWGIFDCLSIVLDYYKRELGIDLGEFDRPDEDWHKSGTDLYAINLAERGFEKVSMPLKQGDVILMQIRSRLPNHAAIFLENGILSTEPKHYPAPMSILHHLQDSASRRDIYGGYWAEKTVSIWRHKNLKQSASMENLAQNSDASIS